MPWLLHTDQKVALVSVKILFLGGLIMRQTTKPFRRPNPAKRMKKILMLGVAAAIAIATPMSVYANNTATRNNQSNPNWQSTHRTENWNFQHNWGYHAPTYQFETTWPVDQWGRPTTSNVAPDRTNLNIRTDRHASVVPPPHGSTIGFFSGEFATNPVNPFSPRYNNNPNAARIVGADSSVFALQPGESGVNVAATIDSQSGGMLASTSIIYGSGSDAGNSGAGGLNNQPSQGGVTITQRPITPGVPQGRATTVTPFPDGSIARITFPTLNNRTATVRPGIALATLDYYVGHFPGTSQWDGNIALASHNRGRGSFFAGIWNMNEGDRIIYETTLGVRTFEVVSIRQISEDDTSNLMHSNDNIITLVTCVYNRPGLRWSVRAREVG